MTGAIKFVQDKLMNHYEHETEHMQEQEENKRDDDRIAEESGMEELEDRGELC